MISNVKYMLKKWAEWDKRGLLFLFISVPAIVLQPIIIAFIPKAMIDCIEKSVSVGRLTIVVVFLSFIAALTTWLAPFMQELLEGSARIIRIRYAVLAFHKNLNADYINIESIEGREKNQRAMEFYRSYDSSASEFVLVCNQILVCFVGVLTSFTLIYKIDIFMIFIILCTCVGEFFLLKYFNKKEKQIKDERNNIVVKFNYFYSLSKDISAAKDVYLYEFKNYFLYYIARLICTLEEIAAKYLRQSVAVSGSRALLNLIRDIIAYGYLTCLVYQGKISVSDFIFYFGIITGFSSWIVNFVFSYANLERCCNDCSAFRDFVESCNNDDRKKTNVTFDSVDSLEFKNVCFAYPGVHDSTIKNMSFKVGKGENIAIVGENGAGKTTVVKLLCGLYYPTSGEILINGQNSRDFSSESYFDLFSTVFQDYSFMPMTIAENVCVCTNYDKEKLYCALEKSGILEKIISLEKKENSLMVHDIYKEAVDFSGGEKQKLLLAKCIYKNAPILVLDEPTAALDPLAENELYHKYNEIMNQKISFFISHRLSSTRFCDRIFFIKNGTVAECGTHEELMQQKGAYYRMYQVQSCYYKETGKDAE